MKCTFALRKLKEKFNGNLLQNVVLLVFLVIFEMRTCCAFVYTGRSAYGCFVAIAVPLNIPHHNAFVSYNFETAYGLPKEPKEYLPGEYQGFAIKEDTHTNYTKVEAMHEDSRKASGSARSSLQNNDSIRSERKSQPLIRKRAIYQMVQDKLKISGLKGEACLLKLICEINSSNLGRYNGVLGTILHILISPSSSVSENLPTKYYKAESNGAIGDCLRYERSCSYSVLDIFSVPLEDLLNKQLSKIVLRK